MHGSIELPALGRQGLDAVQLRVAALLRFLTVRGGLRPILF
jgi:hypothetical protein